jgi:hypothetical protein
MLWFLVFIIGCIAGFVAGAIASPWLGLWEEDPVTGDTETPIADALAREMGIEL